MVKRHSSPALSEQGYDIADVLAAGAESDDSVLDVSTAQNTGIEVADDDEEDDEAFIAAKQAASNRSATSTAKGSRKSGGFQSMGLNPNLIKSITRKGFSIPTPIQRKAIPLILDNQDVVGMARTGSGKTAAFVIPMIEKLKMHSVKVGARAILLSPSRELALQTLKAVKDFGKGTDLRTILLVGGDSLEEQFSQMASNPDIIIATPGRFLHLLVEMSLDLSSIRYLVFDEADRLFEMGFASQLTEILHALPPTRQTLLFSATLPKSLVEFAKAGLKDPNLVRLDAESKISPDLECAFLTIKPHDKEGALFHLLKDVIKVPGKRDQIPRDTTAISKKRKRQPDSANDVPGEHSTIIFTATKYHVEYISTLLQANGYDVSFVYGNLDQTARKIQVDKFRQARTNILVVTDIAARGIDIPMLANVINYDFPSQPKVFVHRVGRTARAGQRGWAYTLVQDSDVPYLLDLQLFLGKKLVLGRSENANPSFASDIVLGGIPTPHLEVSNEAVARLLEHDDDLQNMRTVSGKGEKQYMRSRNQASAQSAKRAKGVVREEAYRQPNHIYKDEEAHDMTAVRDRMLATISGFRPAETVFEIGTRGHASETAETIQRQRARLAAKRAKIQGEANDPVEGDDGAEVASTASSDASVDVDNGMETLIPTLGNTSDEEVDVFIGEPNEREPDSNLESWHDAEHYMGYQPRSINMDEDRAYGVHSGGTSKIYNFTNAARGAELDLGADESKSYSEASRPSQMRWDKRSKKYVSKANDEDGSRGAKMIRGESGQKIAASFRSGRFDAWKRSHRLERLPRTGESENARSFKQPDSGKRFKHHAVAKKLRQPDKYRDDYFKQKKRIAQAKEDGMGGPVAKHELRTAEDVRKQRNVKQRRLEKNARPARKRKQ